MGRKFKISFYTFHASAPNQPSRLTLSIHTNISLLDELSASLSLSFSLSLSLSSFRTKLELTAHVKRMHTADFTPIICDVCGANFRSKANFLIHKKALHPVGPVAEVQCNLCSRWLRDERSLRKHLARHDDREGNNKYRCKLCSAEKSSRVALSSHMRYHHSNKRHGCTLCGKEFKLSRALAVSNPEGNAMI